MNSQEREQLTQFLNQLLGVKLTEKDSEAESLIRDSVARQPDAAYLLVQRSLLQNQALQAAQAKITDLQNQLQQRSASPSNSFLNGDPWAQAPANPNGVPGGSSYQIPSAQPGTGNAGFARAAAPSPSAGIGSSFLGNVATTAAGVVAGSFLFQGIENLLGHHQSGFGQQAFGGQMPEQTVINNYYGDDQLPVTDNDNSYLASNDNDNDSYFDDDSGDSDSDWI
jgi:hypothetical protein